MSKWFGWIILFAAVIFLVYSIVQDLNRGKDRADISVMDNKFKAVKFPSAKELVDPSGFINTDKITIKDLIGKKVILVDFWTFSCINCQRTIPYLNAWYEKYKDKGLEIVGIHTPEFEFEKELKNVQNAVSYYKIKYPVVLDNDFATWNAYANRYWPRKYLIDIDGFIVYDHAGEGAYIETEKKIQNLLDERAQTLGINMDMDDSLAKPEGAEDVDFSKQRSPEIYFGSERNSYLGNGVSGQSGVQRLKEPVGVKTNVLYLVGDWDFNEEFAEAKSKNSKIIFRYQAQKVFMVASAEKGVKAKVLVDSEPVGSKAGSDVKEGFVTFNEDRLYRLVEDDNWGEHTLEIIFEEPGAKVFTFTFG